MLEPTRRTMDLGLDTWLFLKVHDKVAKWRYNRFPWFDDLCIIFEKDRATGHDAQTAADVLEELDKEDASLQGAEDGIHDLNFDSSSMLLMSLQAKNLQRKEVEVWIQLQRLFVVLQG